ncbi:MAG: hypothetical protein Q4G04_06715 [bacterium]|nr:hypothetical protein [bacterium]
MKKSKLGITLILQLLIVGVALPYIYIKDGEKKQHTYEVLCEYDCYLYNDFIYYIKNINNNYKLYKNTINLDKEFYIDDLKNADILGYKNSLAYVSILDENIILELNKENKLSVSYEILNNSYYQDDNVYNMIGNTIYMTNLVNNTTNILTDDNNYTGTIIFVEEEKIYYYDSTNIYVYSTNSNYSTIFYSSSSPIEKAYMKGNNIVLVVDTGIIYYDKSINGDATLMTKNENLSWEKLSFFDNSSFMLKISEFTDSIVKFNIDGSGHDIIVKLNNNDKILDYQYVNNVLYLVIKDNDDNIDVKRFNGSSLEKLANNINGYYITNDTLYYFKNGKIFKIV